MTKIEKTYCFVSIVLACGFLANLVLAFFGVPTNPFTLLLGLCLIMWLPISVLGSILFFLNLRMSLGISAASYATYDIVNYFVTPKYSTPTGVDTATVSGIIFFMLYGIGNVWLLKQLSSRNKQATTSTIPH